MAYKVFVLFASTTSSGTITSLSHTCKTAYRRCHSGLKDACFAIHLGRLLHCVSFPWLNNCVHLVRLCMRDRACVYIIRVIRLHPVHPVRAYCNPLHHCHRRPSSPTKMLCLRSRTPMTASTSVALHEQCAHVCSIRAQPVHSVSHSLPTEMLCFSSIFFIIASTTRSTSYWFSIVSLLQVATLTNKDALFSSTCSTTASTTSSTSLKSSQLKGSFAMRQFQP